MLLGPDGKPIKSEPTVAPEVQQILDQVKAISVQGDYPAALQQMVLAFQRDVSSPVVLDTTVELLTRMMEGRGETQNDELTLFQEVQKNPDNPELYYHLASRFFQLGQYFIARPFMMHALEMLNPTDSELKVYAAAEYAQILMELGGYQDAVNLFRQLNEAMGGLPIELILKMTECLALLRETDEAEANLDIMSDDVVAQKEGLELWRDELGDLMARVHDFDEVETPGLREWHYAQTRGIVLETNPDENMPGERFIFFTPSEEDVAYIISLTAAILDKRGYAPNQLLWIGDSSEVLARLFAEWWEIPAENVRPYRAGDNTDDESEMALLVLAHSYDIMSLQSEEEAFDLVTARAGMVMFALDLHWTDRQPITPDIAGFLSQVCHLPWEAKVEQVGEQITVTPITEKPDPVELAKTLAAKFPDETECDEFATETLADYEGFTDLILDHRDGDLQRKSLVTHSPLPGPRMGF